MDALMDAQMDNVKTVYPHKQSLQVYNSYMVNLREIKLYHRN